MTIEEREAEITPVDSKPRRWPIHAVWIGLVIAVGNFQLYYYIIFTSPDLRDNPWINMPLSWLGIALVVAGAWHVFRQDRGTLRGILKKGFTATAFMLTLFLVGLANWYVFSFSYTLPESLSAAATEDRAPEFALLDHDSQPVSLSDYRGKNVVLVFYRGDW